VPTAFTLITEQVRERVRREGVDVRTEPQLVDRFVRNEVRAYSERARGGSVHALSDEASAARQIVATLTGFGSLQRFLDDESIEEIWINAPDRAFAIPTMESSFENLALIAGLGTILANRRASEALSESRKAVTTAV